MFTTHDGDAVALIVSANTHRRQLNYGQVAMARAVALVEQGKRREGRWQEGQTSSVDDVSTPSLTRAGVVLDADPSLGEQVLTGAVSLRAAYEQTNERRRRVATQTRRLETLRTEAPDLVKLLNDEALDLDEVWAAYEARTAEARAEAEQIGRGHRDANKAVAEAVFLRARISETASTRAS